MNLHLLPDDKYVNRFIQRIENLNLSERNKFFIKSKLPFRYVKKDLQPVNVGEKKINCLIGNTKEYEKVFIHFMDEDSIDFINQNSFKYLVWVPWGADIYESLFSDFKVEDNETKKVLGRTLSNRVNRLVYRHLEQLTKYRKYKSAYSKVNTLLNWIPEEFEYAKHHLPGLHPEKSFFIYDQDISFPSLLSYLVDSSERKSNYRIMVGYSGLSNNNHLSALEMIGEANIKVEAVSLPVSYGDMNYIRLLEEEVRKRNFPFEVIFNKQYTSFEKYINYLNSFDVLVFNPIRPAGMGNFWVGIFLGKRVFLNKGNLAFSFLKQIGLDFHSVDEIAMMGNLGPIDIERNRKICLDFFSESRLNDVYGTLFS